jgi:hypothetical protein
MMLAILVSVTRGGAKFLAAAYLFFLGGWDLYIVMNLKKTHD